MSIREEKHVATRYLGLSLGGAKSDRTCLTVLDHYRSQNKAFIVDIHHAIGSKNGRNGDEVLVEFINKLQQPTVCVLGVDAPLTLPPCLLGCHNDCHGYEKCKKPAVRWMKKEFSTAKLKNPKLKHFTPYSQRPVDLYFRYRHMGLDLFQDETMGANLAPQAVRMHYLKKFISHISLIEVWPKLCLFYLQKSFKLTRSDVMAYRNVEKGPQVRSKIIDSLSKRSNLFIYDKDYKTLISDMTAFDSLLCSWVAMLFDFGQSIKFRSSLPLETGWVQIPEL